MKYNITKTETYRGGDAWVVTVVELDRTEHLGRFDSRDKARQRVKDHKLVVGTLQKTYLSLTDKVSYDEYRLKLLELGVKFNTARSDDTEFEYIILIPAISKDDFDKLTEEIR